MSNESEVKPMDGLATWLRSQAEQLDGAAWRNDPAVREHVEMLRQWASEVEASRRTPAQAGAGAVAYMDAAKFAALRKCPERGGVLTTVTSHRAFPEDVALYAGPPAALLEQARQALEAMTFGCEHRSIGGDKPDWHRIQMPSRGALDKARAALSALEAHRKGQNNG